LIAAAGLCLAFVQSFVLVVIVFVLVGAGGAVMDVGGNTLVVWSQPVERTGSTLNALHLSFGVGALITPLLVSRSLLWGNDLLWFSLVLAGSAVLLAVLLLRAAEPPHRAAVHREPTSLPSHRKGLALVCLFFVLYVGLETGFAGWVHTYAEEIHLGGVGTAGLLTSVFWIGFTGGRLCAIWLVRRIGVINVLIWSCLVATAAIGVIAVTGGSSPTVWVATALFGAAVGPQFPSMIAHSDERLALSGSSTSLLIASAGLGGLVLPLGIGWLFDRRGAAAMPWTVMVASVATTIVVVTIVVTIGQRPPVTSMNAPVT
jgi:fucose permease